MKRIIDGNLKYVNYHLAYKAGNKNEMVYIVTTTTDVHPCQCPLPGHEES